MNSPPIRSSQKGYAVKKKRIDTSHLTDSEDDNANPNEYDTRDDETVWASDADEPDEEDAEMTDGAESDEEVQARGKENEDDVVIVPKVGKGQKARKTAKSPVPLAIRPRTRSVAKAQASQIPATARTPSQAQVAPATLSTRRPQRSKLDKIIEVITVDDEPEHIPAPPKPLSKAPSKAPSEVIPPPPEEGKAAEVALKQVELDLRRQTHLEEAAKREHEAAMARDRAEREEKERESKARTYAAMGQAHIEQQNAWTQGLKDLLELKVPMEAALKVMGPRPVQPVF